MAIDPQAPNELAQQATGTGGVTKTLTGVDVLPGQMSLDLGIDDGTDGSGEEYEVAGLSVIRLVVGLPGLLGALLAHKTTHSIKR